MRKSITYFNKAEKHYDNDEFDLALQCINRAIIINNTDYSYYKMKGHILRMQDKYKKALN